MTDDEKLANVLVNYSCDLKEGEKVLIDCTDVPAEFISTLIKTVKNAKAYPFVYANEKLFQKELLRGTTKEYADLKTKYMLPIMKDMDAYIGVRSEKNSFELSDIDSESQKNEVKYFIKPVHLEERVNNTKWVILRYPSSALAQQAQMSLEKFKELFYKVCTLDYSKMNKSMDKLVAFMEKTDRVKIVSKSTSLIFSIKGQKAIKCSGERNIPDGEVYTSPIRDSINGTIEYNIPSLYEGKIYNNIKFIIKNGKIENCTCYGDIERLNHILNTDEGARCFGEFAIGVNPYLTQSVCDTLFDEKICGSFHLTPGDCYEDAPNGNTSSIHWDLVQCHLPEYGGGDIYFDDILIRHNGKFVIKELLGLNPENLI